VAGQGGRGNFTCDAIMHADILDPFGREISLFPSTKIMINILYSFASGRACFVEDYRRSGSIVALLFLSSCE
jgi:hypothetical protein